MGKRDYCTLLRKEYVGDRPIATRPEGGNDYIYTCSCRYKGGYVRGNPFKTKDTLCLGCEHFKSNRGRF